MSELLNVKRWIGEFFLPDLYDKRFSGEINYSPEQGVLLTYTITSKKINVKTNVLHGILSTGEKCTLFGEFSSEYAGTNMRNGLTTYPGKTQFWCLAIGDFLTADDCFDNCDFSLTNLQEFFYPSGHKDAVKFTDKPIYSAVTPFGILEVGNTASFGFVNEDISSHIYSRDESASEALNHAFKEVKSMFPESSFMLKKEIAYRIFLKFSPELTIKDAFKHLVSLQNLFAVLIYGPVYPESIRFVKNKLERQHTVIDIFPAMHLDPRTIKLATEDQFHWNMPITKSTTPFDKIVSTWLNSPQNRSPVVNSIQHGTGYSNLHVVHGEIVLYATQFESISTTADQKDKKYEYPLMQHATPQLRDFLKKIFQVSSIGDVGIAIGDLRNEITHIGRPKRWLETLSLTQQIRISQYLQLTIIGYLLANIGVPSTAIGKYQNTYSAVD